MNSPNFFTAQLEIRKGERNGQCVVFRAANIPRNKCIGRPLDARSEACSAGEQAAPPSVGAAEPRIAGQEFEDIFLREIGGPCVQRVVDRSYEGEVIG